MWKYTLLFISAALLVSGCTKKSQTASTEFSGGRPVVLSGDGPAFVTDRVDQADLLTIEAAETGQSVAPVEHIEAITFDPSETKHVRLVDYNPFGSDSEMTVDLDQMACFFCYPYPGHKISDYGMRGRSMHTGVDIKTPPNDTIRVVLGGVVRMSTEYSGYGNIVVVRHQCGLETAYAHNSKNLVAPNDVVCAGQAIALSGRTGRATTEHVHFEMRIMGEHFDPNLFLDTQNHTIRSGKLNLTRRNGRILASNSSVSGGKGATPRTQALARNASPTKAPVPETYIVQRGDTLYSISRKYGSTVEQLCALNGIAANGVLNIGQKLKLQE